MFIFFEEYLFYVYTIVIYNFKILCLRRSKILGWGSTSSQVLKLNSMSYVFMLYKISCLLFLCFTRLQCFLFCALQDFMSSVFFFIIYETSMSFVVMFYNTWMSYVFMSYRTSGSSILRFYRTTRSLFLSYKTSMSFCFINFTILFSQSCNIELQNHSNEISVIIFT